MSDAKLTALNDLLITQELFDIAKGIMTEYQTAVDEIMQITLQNDVKSMMEKLSYEERKEMLKNNNSIDAFAKNATGSRMGKYGEEFFDIEIIRLLDAYNDGIYDNTEFKIRCAVLDSLKDTLNNYSNEYSDGVTDNIEDS